ncbi:glycosyl transferase family 2 [Spirosoma oryzae]|uniref:Glycosyl transferase family 2 n=1 Tax=Spirosoma oryzae TaxID=1469603 RepID=A0A2T0TBU5_9BACT|nr:glycosyltransferase family A protein [Spirosoma oryzae]PRY43133.1 glycosyl transferase family 2 [Spirosoma oryzae]
MSPDLSVVITTFQQPAQLLKCLDALERQSLPRHQFEVIVVDDGDSPATATAVALFTRQLNQQHGALDVRYLPQSVRRGSAAARNRGWQAARGRIVAFTNGDCLPQPTWLANALACFDDATEVVTGQLWLQPPYADEPLGPDTLAADPVSLLSANCFCRKTTLERLGGFPTTVTYSRQADLLFLTTLIQQAVPIRKSKDVLVVQYIPVPHNLPGRYTHHPMEGAAVTDEQAVRQFWAEGGTSRQSLPVHWAAISGAVMGLMGVLTGGILMAMTGFGVWVTLAALFGKREYPSMQRRMTLLTIVWTRLSTPFVSVYWHLYSAIKYGVMH